MNDLSRGETVLLIVLIWTTWIIFYWAGKNNLLGYMSDTISDFGKQLSESMRKTEEVKITKNEKDGLIELLCTAGWNLFTDSNAINQVADHLLANGVIVPLCKVGDSIFRVGNGEIWEWLIEHIEIYEDEIGFVDDCENYFTPDKIGKTVFLTREEAEQALKKRPPEVTS